MDRLLCNTFVTVPGTITKLLHTSFPSNVTVTGKIRSATEQRFMTKSSPNMFHQGHIYATPGTHLCYKSDTSTLHTRTVPLRHLQIQCR